MIREQFSCEGEDEGQLAECLHGEETGCTGLL